MSRPDLDWTLGDAKQWTRERARRGVKCPLCEQDVKVYRRKLNAGIARALIAMYRHNGTDWMHKPTVLSGLGAAARDESIARYWGLLEEEIEVRRDDGGRAGYWRVTEHGRAFVLGRARVLSHALLYDGKCLGLTGDPVDIAGCLGEPFQFDELMRA